MKMKYGLPGRATGVYHQTIPIRRKPLLARYLCGHEEELP
jgi:hypothetical protein